MREGGEKVLEEKKKKKKEDKEERKWDERDRASRRGARERWKQRT